MESLIALFLFIFGLLIGSFVNVLTLRFGFVEHTRPRSECQACAQTLSWYELIPLLSYVLLRGKCSACGAKISIQYPLVELLTGCLFLWTYFVFAPVESLLVLVPIMLLLLFWASFVALLVYDIRHTLVPIHFVAPLFSAALLTRIYEAFLFGSYAPLVDALFGALTLGGFMLLIVLITKGKGMGVGDIYVAGALGILFGVTRGIEVLTLAFWIGAVVGVALVVYSGVRQGALQRSLSSLEKNNKNTSPGKGFKMKSEVPFVPFLFVAAVLGAYTGIAPFELTATLISLL